MTRVRIRRAHPVVAFILGLLMMLGGAALQFYYMNPAIQTANESLLWPSTTGSIIKSEINEYKSGSGSKRKTMYQPDIHFTYYIDGHHFSNSSIDVGPSSGSSDASASYRKVNKYPLGASVRVFYNPKDPSQAVLEQGMPTSLVWIGRGVKALIILGFMMVAWQLIKLLLTLFILCRAESGSTESVSA